MRKRTIIFVIIVFAILAATAGSYAIRKAQKDTNTKGDWVEKTINKEAMKTDADCGIVSVKMLLDFYGMDVSYGELKKKINSTVDGTDWKDIKEYFKTLNKVETLEFKENIDIAKEYLEKGYPLFICWDVDNKPVWSHYSILIAIDKYSVWMLDPAEKKSLSQYSLDYFLPCWKNEEYWFCILEEKDNNIAIQKQLIGEDSYVKSGDSKEQDMSDSLAEFTSTISIDEIDNK